MRCRSRLLLPPTCCTTWPMKCAACSRRITIEGPSGIGVHRGKGLQRTNDASWPRARAGKLRAFPTTHARMSAPDSDPALETLLLPFANGALQWPADGALFLRARDGWPLHQQRAAGPGLRTELQARRRCAAALGLRAGRCRRSTTLFPLVLVLPPRQRDEARALLARAIARAAPGGRVLACMPNNEGAKSGEGDLARLAGPLQTLSKNHCRVFWTAPLHGAVDPALAAQWRAAGCAAADRSTAASSAAPACSPGTASTRPRRCSPRTCRPTCAATAPTSARASAISPAKCWRAARGVTALDLYEAEARALDLARGNLAGVRGARRARLPLARRHRRPAAALRLHRQQSAVPCAGPRRSPRHRPRFIAAAAAALQPGRPAVAGRQPPPAVRSGARRQLRQRAHAGAAATASR